MDNVTEGDKKRITKKQVKMIAELDRSLGLVTSACKETGISRETHYRWLKNNPLYADKVNELEEKKEDIIEKAFLNLVIDMNPSAVIHAVKTKLKHRGYGEENTVNNNINGGGFKLIIGDGKMDNSKMGPESETKASV